MINKIMNEKSLIEKPPVLFDIGASGDIHKDWKKIAKYSICVGFDPDDREVSITKKSGKGFKEFLLVNKIVSDQGGKRNFYLTKSPYCSSSLKTDLERLKPYNFRSLFEINKELMMPSISINSTLLEMGHDYIDWYKTDTQGTDFRIFDVIKEEVKNNILVAEFEPGILDSYIGEDKLWKIMENFDKSCFWSSDCIIKGASRINEEFLNKNYTLLEKKLIKYSHKKTAFWAEISYMNDMKNQNFKERDYLLMIVFAIIKKQYGFVIEICDAVIAEAKYNPIFNDIRKYTINKIKINAYLSLPKALMRKAGILKYV